MNGINNMQLHQTTEQQHHVINTPRLLQTMKGLGPRSYEKAFQGFTHDDVLRSMSMALSGITREQVTIGLNTMLDQGYCPDPIMFRKWCLGIKGFVGDADPVKDSYKGKHAAIANIEAWRTDRSVSITNAEREAYNRVYGMFQDLQYANNYEKQKFYAYEAFKDAYAEVVRELVEKGEKQTIWDSSLSLETKKKPVVSFGVDYLNTTPGIQVYRVSKTGFKSFSISIKKLDVREYMRENNINVFDKAERELISLEIKKINWVAE